MVILLHNHSRFGEDNPHFHTTQPPLDLARWHVLEEEPGLLSLGNQERICHLGSRRMGNLLQTRRQEPAGKRVILRRVSPKRHEPFRTPAASLHPETETAPRLARDKSRRREIRRIFPPALKRAGVLRKVDLPSYPG